MEQEIVSTMSLLVLQHIAGFLCKCIESRLSIFEKKMSDAYFLDGKIKDAIEDPVVFQQILSAQGELDTAINFVLLRYNYDEAFHNLWHLDCYEHDEHLEKKTEYLTEKREDLGLPKWDSRKFDTCYENMFQIKVNPFVVNNKPVYSVVFCIHLIMTLINGIVGKSSKSGIYDNKFAPYSEYVDLNYLYCHELEQMRTNKSSTHLSFLDVLKADIEDMLDLNIYSKKDVDIALQYGVTRLLSESAIMFFGYEDIFPSLFEKMNQSGIDTALQYLAGDEKKKIFTKIPVALYLDALERVVSLIPGATVTDYLDQYDVKLLRKQITRSYWFDLRTKRNATLTFASMTSLSCKNVLLGKIAGFLLKESETKTYFDRPDYYTVQIDEYIDNIWTFLESIKLPNGKIIDERVAKLPINLKKKEFPVDDFGSFCDHTTITEFRQKRKASRELKQARKTRKTRNTFRQNY